MKKLTTFISYSRRQLYFAESLALHLYLQKEGINVWFDLQQLQAGTVWSESLKKGVGEASLLVLVVSQASWNRRIPRPSGRGLPARAINSCLHLRAVDLGGAARRRRTIFVAGSTASCATRAVLKEKRSRDMTGSFGR